MAQYPAFKPGKWQETIDVRDFIQTNYTPYEGDASFLAGPTARTQKVNAEYERLHKEEYEKGGVLDVDVNHVSESCFSFNFDKTSRSCMAFVYKSLFSSKTI